MFEDLFVDPRTKANLWSAPLLEERLRYLRHSAQSGARPSTLRRIAAAQTSLVRLLDLREAERVSMPRIEAVARQWAQRGGCRLLARRVRPETRRCFVGHALRWLRFAGLLEEPCKVRHAHADEVAVFGAWMRKERGCSEETISGCQSTVDRFVDWLGEWGFHPGETVPKGLDRDEVLRLLATSEGDRPADVRDRAILMVLIAYGLRSGEVAGLRLDDVDWTEETLRVRCPKPGRTHHYPLSRGVGQAIVRYLTEVRPQRPHRTLFLTLRAPILPLGRGAMSQVVRRRLDRLGITGKRRGPHALRHAAAQHLLDQGVSFKEVGDYLGHRSISSTAVYAKVQLGTLREVADIDLEGLA